MIDLIRQLGEQYELDLRTGYNATRGFFIQLCSDGKHDNLASVHLPDLFIKLTKAKNALNFTTPDLVRSLSRIELDVELHKFTDTHFVYSLFGANFFVIQRAIFFSEVISMLIVPSSHAFVSIYFFGKYPITLHRILPLYCIFYLDLYTEIVMGNLLFDIALFIYYVIPLLVFSSVISSKILSEEINSNKNNNISEAYRFCRNSVIKTYY